MSTNEYYSPNTELIGELEPTAQTPSPTPTTEQRGRESKLGQASEVRQVLAGQIDSGPTHGAPGVSPSSALQAKEIRGLSDRPKGSDVHSVADAGLGGSGERLPHFDAVQAAFSPHDLSGVKAHRDGAAKQAASSMGAAAYAKGEHVAFGGDPDVATVAHEAAHVVQQRQGVSLAGGVGRPGDSYERNADAVAERVVSGHAAADLLGSTGGAAGTAVQAKKGAPKKSALVDRIRKEANQWYVARSHKQIFGDLAKCNAAERAQIGKDTKLMKRFVSVFSITEMVKLLTALKLAPVDNANWLQKTGKASKVKGDDIRALAYGNAKQLLALVESSDDFSVMAKGLKERAACVPMYNLFKDPVRFHSAMRHANFRDWVWSNPKEVGPALFSAKVSYSTIALTLSIAGGQGKLDVAIGTIANAEQAKVALLAAHKTSATIAQAIETKALETANLADIKGDPKDMKKTAKGKAKSTEHRSADPEPNKRNAPLHSYGGKLPKFEVLRGRDNPLVAETATDAQLFKRGKGKQVGTKSGSAKKPVEQVRYNPKLFMGPGMGKPAVEDVKQGSIGDCYFMAAMAHLATSDPKRLQRSMFLKGTTATTMLHHKDGAAWKPTVVQTDTKLLYNKGRWGTLVGAKPRIDPKEQKAKRKYFAEVKGGRLSVYKETFFDAAMWVPLIEKAWVSFAQKHGKYGTSAGSGKKSAYTKVDAGGWSRKILNLFYGSAATHETTGQIKYTPGKKGGLDPKMLGNNRALLLQLANMQQGLGTKGSKTMVFASSFSQTLPRLQKQIQGTLASKAGKKLPNWQRNKLKYTAKLIKRYLKATGKKKTKWHGRVVKRCARHIRKKGSYRIKGLHNDKAPPEFKQLLELMVTISRQGFKQGTKDNTAGNPGQRMIEPGHAYAILAAHFVDASGKAMDLAKLVTTLAGTGKINIDPTKSSVSLHNPWAHGDPNPALKGVADRKDDGQFKLTLDQYLRLFTQQGSVRVR